MKISTFPAAFSSRGRSLCGAALLMIMAWLPPIAAGAVIEVDSLADAGPGSLRAAVAEVEAGGTVVLRASGDLVLLSPIQVDRRLSIRGADGPEAHRLSGGGASRIFIFGPEAEVVVSGLTLDAGFAEGDGGAVLSDGSVALEDVRIVGSRANGGGGGLAVRRGSAHLQAVTLSGNVAVSGGGLFVGNSARAQIVESSVAANRASETGGGVAVASGGRATVFRSALVLNDSGQQGGAMSVGPGGRATLDTSTVSANTAGLSAGAVASAGLLTVRSATIADNRADSHGAPGLLIFSGGRGSIFNSLLAHDSANGISLSNGAVFSSAGYNLSSAFEPVLAHPFDIRQTDPLLGPLALNGGSTLSHLPQAGSPAIDAGDPTGAPAIDQRGQPRIQGAAIDIGSVEVAVSPPEIAPLEDVFTTTDPGDCGALIFFAAEVTSEDATPPSVTYEILPNASFPEGLLIESPFVFPAGVHEVEVTATGATGLSASARFFVTVEDPFLNCANNVSWPNALPLDLETEVADGGRASVVYQFVARRGESRWYRFPVQPGGRVTVVLSDLPANYDLVLFSDIAAEYERRLNLFNSPDPRDQDLALLGAEFAPESFSPESFSPESFSPESYSPESFSPESFSPESFSPALFSPESFSPESFSPESFSPESFSPESFSPESFSPESFSPESFSPESFSPESFSPEAFASAQASSMIAFSSFPGRMAEAVSLNTFNRGGNFYVRVRGAGGTFSQDAPFTLTVVFEAGLCDGVQGPDSFGQASLAADAGDYRTLVLWDSLRTPGGDDELSALEASLDAFAARPEVAGAIIDIALEDRVFAANAQADAFPACPYAKNLVALEIKALVDAWRVLNPDLTYIVLLGSDDAIPFFRTVDQASLANESNYHPPVIDRTHSQSSLRFGQVLTQDPYGSFCELTLVTGSFAFPQLAVGRLVESAAEIRGQIENYLLTNGGLLPVPRSALVTGYDFLDDGAQAVEVEFAAALGRPVSTLIAAADVPPALGWTADDLAAILFAERYDLVFLAGHFSTAAALAADYRTRFTAADLLASDSDFTNTIVFSAGCHSGYNTVDSHAVPFITRQPDWAQAFGRLGAIYIAGTGYQYGDTEFVEYGERLYLEFSRELRTGIGPVSVGEALNRAKRKYLAETPLMRGIHEKTLVQATLYGLPMLKLDVPGERLAPSLKGSPAGILPSGVASDPGLTLGLGVADLAVSPQLVPRNRDLVNVVDGSTVTARWFEGRDGIVTNPIEPVRPLEVFLVSAPGTLLRGVGFRGGVYEDLYPFLPLTGAPVTEIRGVFNNFFSETFFPIQPFSVSYLGLLCGGVDGETRLNVYPAQYFATGGGAIGGTLRAYSAMDFRLFYSNNRQNFGDSENVRIPALSGPPSIVSVFAEEGEAPGTVEFYVEVTGDPAAGIQESWITYTGLPGSSLYGAWHPLDLLQDAYDSLFWSGVLDLPEDTEAADIRFIAQAVSGTGLVALRTNLGAYFSVGADEVVERADTELILLDPLPESGPYGESVVVSALLHSFGEPLAGKFVDFRIGNTRVAAETGASGVATARIPLTGRPGSYLLQAAFVGDTFYEPSAASAPFTIVRQATRITFPPPDSAKPSDFAVLLTDVHGAPLRERSLFFVVDDGEIAFGFSAITDFSGRAFPLDTDNLPNLFELTVYFSGTIPIPGFGPVTLEDNLYLPSTASIEIELAIPDELALTPTEVEVIYAPESDSFVYDRLSFKGDLVFVAPLSPLDLPAEPNAQSIWIYLEAWLGGDRIASGTSRVSISGSGVRRTWLNPDPDGEGIEFIQIVWDDSPEGFVGRLFLRLEGDDAMESPLSDATPNRLEIFGVFGVGPGETEARFSVAVGEGEGALPWTLELPDLKQFTAP